jgi:hypothetical protein
VQEGEPVRVLIDRQCRFVHQATDGEVGQQQTPELLSDQLWDLAAQAHACSAQVRLQLVQSISQRS